MMFEFTEVVGVYLVGARILEHLCYVDRVGLARAYPPMLSWFPEHYEVKSIIAKRLRKVFDDMHTKWIMNSFYTERVLAGSFLLECIYDVEWNTTVDIIQISDTDYDTDDAEYLIDNETVSVMLRHSGLHCQKKRHRSINDREILVPIRTSDANRAIVWYDKKKQEKVKFIPRSQDLHDNIQSVVGAFDLTVCQVFYDGKKIRIRHFDDVLLRKFDVNQRYTVTVEGYVAVNMWTQDLAKRVPKYIKRGLRQEAHNILVRDMM
jgi:hypothetical protein